MMTMLVEHEGANLGLTDAAAIEYVSAKTGVS
jgi:hypothetical protein